jgi:hypothetical protein
MKLLFVIEAGIQSAMVIISFRVMFSSVASGMIFLHNLRCHASGSQHLSIDASKNEIGFASMSRMRTRYQEQIKSKLKNGKSL